MSMNFIKSSKASIVFVMLLVFLMPVSATAVPRADDALTDRQRQENSLEKLLDSPVENYGKITGLFLNPRNPNLEADLAMIGNRLQNTQDGARRSALSLIKAKAQRLLTVQQARMFRDNTLLRGLPAELLPPLAEAYTQLPLDKSTENLHAAFVHEIISLLLNSKTAPLPDDVKKALTDKFLHSPRHPLEALSLDQFVTIYQRCGAEEELLEQCALPIAKINQNSLLFRTMQLAYELKDVEAAFPYAEELVKRLDKSGADKSQHLRKAGEIIAEVNPDKALNLLSAYAESYFMLYLVLYDASRSVKQYGSVKEYHEAWLKPYFEKAGQNLDYYVTAISRFKNNQDYEAVLYACSYLDKVEDKESDISYWSLLMVKGKSLVALGKLPEAKALYKSIMENTDISPHLKTQARQELRFLEKD